MVRASTIGVCEVNIWTLCDVIKSLVVAVFDSMLASLRNQTIDTSELCCGAHYIPATCVGACAPDSRTGHTSGNS